MKKLRKIAGVLLALAMVVTMLPATASATETDGSTTVGSSGVVTSKTATLEDDGTYTINLEAYATGETQTITSETSVPLDIVLVIDQSGSMAYNDRGNSTSTASDRRMYKLQQAVTSFVNSISQNAAANGVDHRIAIAGFASSGTTGRSTTVTGAGYNGNDSYWVNTGLYINGSFVNYGNNSRNSGTKLTSTDYQNALVSVNDGNGNVASSITSAINLFKASGGTYTEYGLLMAQNVFANNSNTYQDEDGNTVTRKRVVVLFTDGETNSQVSTVLNYSNTLKNTYSADVYCVGFGSGLTDFLNYVSSNYLNSSYVDNGPNRGYSGTSNGTKYTMTSSNSDELEEIFETIATDIQNPTTTVTLDKSAVLKDIMAEGFSLESASVSVKTVAGTTTDDSSYSWGTETTDPAGVTATIDTATGTVSVTGFDYAENYITTGHAGAKLVVTITGVVPTDDAVTGSAVATNATTSGIYENDTAETAVATFPVPETILTSKAYVLDYAKTAKLSDLDQDQSVTAVVDEMAAVSGSETSLTGDYGKTELEGSTVSYTPTTTNWNGYDSFYVFGKTSETTVTDVSANKNGNLWSKVSVIPANNVYYEDDFITSEDGSTVGIVYTGTWTTDGTNDNNTETANGDVQGWEVSLADDATYSDGSAHKAVASEDNSATASFTFTGTGVDVYSRTNMDTGVVTAILTGGPEGGTVTKILSVDNYADSGDYYQIPTLSFDDLVYGTYTLTICVTNSAEGRATYYLDGIRVYNPIQNLEEDDETVQEAYGDEIGATFTQVRDMLDEGSTVFIDEDEKGDSYAGAYDQSTYEIYGPENEVYLASGQAIVFQVTGTTANSKFYVGMKAPNGTTSVEYSSGTVNTTETISHASDLYYEVTPGTNGYVVIKNTGNNLLSVTKLRITSGATVTTTLDTQEALDAYNAFTLLSTVTDDSEGLTEDEVTDVDTETTEDTEVDVVIENPDSYENPDSGSDADQSSASTVKSVIGNLVQSLFDSIKSLFSR